MHSRHFLTPFLLSSILLATACSASADNDHTAPNGEAGTRNFSLTGYDSVELTGPDTVVIRTGSAASVSATGDKAMLDRLEITVDKGVLRIGRQKREGFNFSWGNKSHQEIVITVTMPNIKGAKIAGSGELSIDRVEGPDFAGAIAGSGDLNIAALQTTSANFSIAGSGAADVKGTTGSMKVNIAGSGDFDAAGLMAKTADISVAGSGEVKTGVSDIATISIMGSGDVDITGTAICTVNKQGSGEVRCNNTATAQTTPTPPTAPTPPVTGQ